MRWLKRGDVVRVRLVGDGDSDWCQGWVALASDTDPSSVMLILNGAVRTRAGGVIADVLPVRVDYTAQTVTDDVIGDSEYELEVAEQHLPFFTLPLQ